MVPCRTWLRVDDFEVSGEEDKVQEKCAMRPEERISGVLILLSKLS